MSTDATTVADAAADAPQLPASAGRVLLEILIHGPLSRVELARRLGLSGPSLTRLTKPLIASGRLIEGIPKTGSAGRPSQPLDIDQSAEHFAGVKVTREALYTVVTDLRGVVEAESECAVDDRDPTAVARAIATQVNTLGNTHQPLLGIGISIGGRTADGRTVAESNFLGWHEVPLAELVEEASGHPVVVSNDVNALAQEQAWFGAGRGLESFAMVTIGAGVGLGLVSRGELIRGRHGGAGSIGHQRLMDSDVTCWRGHRGCANALLTTDAIEQHAARLAGRMVAFPDILLGAERGDPELRLAVDRAGEALGLLLASVANSFDPERILVAGEGARLGVVAEHVMLQAIRQTKAWHDAETPVDVQHFSFNEWARGAAAMAIQARVLGEVAALD